MALRRRQASNEFRSVVGDNATELAQIAPALRRVFPGLPPPLELPAQETRRYLFQSVTDTFMRVARRVPLLLVLDRSPMGRRGQSGAPVPPGIPGHANAAISRGDLSRY